MSKKFSAIPILIGCLMLIGSGVVLAGSGDFDSEGAYPGVGAIIVPEYRFRPICSSVLIEESVALTAGHCTEFLEILQSAFQVWVSFQADPFEDCSLGDNYSDCGWVEVIGIVSSENLPSFTIPPWAENADDIGALFLETAQSTDLPYVVSYVGEIDDLIDGLKPKDIKLTVVGYGSTPNFPPQHGPSFSNLNVRLIGHPRFLNAKKKYLLTQQNEAAGNTGACFGDSGGPLFLEIGDMEILIALVNGGPNFCISTGVYYRLDTPEGQAFIESVTE